jgi:hypothetical protein
VTLPVALQREFNIFSVVQAENTMVQIDIAMLLSIIGMEPGNRDTDDHQGKNIETFGCLFATRPHCTVPNTVELAQYYSAPKPQARITLASVTAHTEDETQRTT